MSVTTAVEVNKYALVGTAIVAQFQYVDSDGEPADPGGVPTVTVVDATGAAVTIGLATLVTGTTGLYEATITAVNNDTVTQLTASWVSASVTYTTTIAVIGAWPFSVAQLKAFDLSVNIKDAASLIAARLVALSELCDMANRSPVPMFASAKLNGAGAPSVVLPHVDIRAVSAVYNIASDGTETAWTAAERSYIDVRRESGLLTMRSGSWFDDVRIEYTYGLDMPPTYLRNAMMTRCVWWANQEASTLMERTTSWSTGEGGTYRYDMAGENKTGMPNVDGPYKRFGRADPGFA
jgi:hypothetical protein